MKRQRKNRVLVRKEKGRIRVKWVREVLNVLMQAQGLEGKEVSLYLTDDNTVRLLNREFRGKDKPTDVLSFVYDEQVGKYRLLGEIVISMDTARRQAEELGHSFEEEIKRLLVHGFVHLLGYDHEPGGEEEKKFMETEGRLMDALDKQLHVYPSLTTISR